MGSRVKGFGNERGVVGIHMWQSQVENKLYVG